MFIARRAFRDFTTIEELLAPAPPEGDEMVLLAWKEDLLDKPIYQRKDGKIDSVFTFNACLRALCTRAGYAVPPTIHDFRAEALFFIDPSVYIVFIL